MKEKIAKWLKTTKTYPNGSTFSRGESLTYLGCAILALVGLLALSAKLISKFLWAIGL